METDVIKNVSITMDEAGVLSLVNPNVFMKTVWFHSHILVGLRGKRKMRLCLGGAMSKVKYDGWAMKNRGYVFPLSCRELKRDVVKWWEEGWDLEKFPQFAWKNYRKKGTHKIVKVRIVEVDE